MGYRIGVDTGGTFTDLVVLDEANGTVEIVKRSSSPDDPSRAFADVVGSALKQFSIPPSSVNYLVHGTTVATNTIIEGKGARTALLTTEGFRDVLEIARQIRPELYDVFTDKPKPLVPRRLCRGIPERLDFRGEVVTPLDAVNAKKVIGEVLSQQVESIAVCLLHSYQNPKHEQHVGRWIRELSADVAVSLSSDLCPEMREYYRTSTTVINALVVPVVANYIRRISERMGLLKISTDLHLMTSAGGMITAQEACIAPVQLIESGPAAGVTAAAHLGRHAGFDDVISFDMGGTTAKTGLIEGGQPRVAAHFEVGAAAMVADRAAGYPVRTPVIDLVEIGAGGGSIAWIDPGGALRVGPTSAGAMPGPACYGKGQELPTVTDANLVLGRLDPDYFVGGEIKLNPQLAEAAIDRIAKPLKLSRYKAAYGILEIANANMGSAIQLVSVQRGFDPREFTLVAFGGAGPLHANALAREAQIPRTLIPPSPGVASAWGLLVCDLRFDLVRPFLGHLGQSLAKEDRGSLQVEFDSLQAQAKRKLFDEGIQDEDQQLSLYCDMRYVGQSFELSVPFDQSEIVDSKFTGQLISRFQEVHRQAYGHATDDAPVEIVHLRITATGKIPHPEMRELPSTTTDLSTALRARRKVYFSEHGMMDCPIYDRYKLNRGHLIQGPAVVDELDSTTVIEPEYQAYVDRVGNLLLTSKDLALG